MCSFAAEQEVPISPEDEFYFAKRRRLSTAYASGENGQREFHLYYGNKELVFDEPELFAFGEALAQIPRFTASEAMSWGNGYTWRHVSQLLNALVADEVLVRAPSEPGEPAEPERKEGTVVPLLPRTGNVEPRSWLMCEELTRELCGRALEIGYLELVVPFYRIAHASLDADGRQVGEANVFTPALRLDVPTEWRVCQYPGSRFQDQCPMNLSALKAMTRYWRPLMALIQRLRAEYLQRFPDARERMNLGHIEQLCSLILAFPTYLLMREQDRIENGALHPLLSSMFRVTDGLRLSAQALLSVPDDGTAPLPPTACRSSSEIYDYTERTLGFMSAYGVCAGPRHLVEEFLALVIDGKLKEGSAAPSFDPEVTALLDSLPRAFDYGFQGSKAYAVSSCLWCQVAVTYQELGRLLDSVPETDSAELAAWRALVSRSVTHLREKTVLANPTMQQAFERRYAHMFREAERGLGVAAPRDLESVLAPREQASHAAAREQLQALLGQRFGLCDGADTPWLDTLGGALMDYFKRAQAIVSCCSAVQEELNAVLGRPTPTRPLSGADLAIHNLFLPTSPPFPNLEDDLAQALAIQVTVTSAAVEITDLSADNH
ncbi:MAG TPA: hypothetical protein VER96_39720 [Polyangiaceae bacterium]|nr:hypothetical protein [Polyangiaceae bacterium]